MTEIAIAAFGFNESTWRLQPWRYYYEIAAYLDQVANNSAYVISFESEVENVGEDQIHGVDVLHKEISILEKIEGSAIIDILEDLNPDHLIWPVDQFSVGYSRFLQKSKIPTTGIYPGLWYTLCGLRHLSLSETIHNREYMTSRVLMSVLPDSISGLPFLRGYFDTVITLSSTTKNRLVTVTGMEESDVQTIMPGIDTTDFEHPNQETLKSTKAARNYNETKTNLLYMGSPLTIRGIDTVLDSLHRIDSETVELTILSRRHTDPETGEEHYVNNEQWIQQKCLDLNICEDVNIVPGFLSREEVRAHISLSDIVCLPFKTLQADMPLSILEVMAQGRVPIATTVGGIPDLINHGERGLLVEPANPGELANSIKLLDSNPELLNKFAQNAEEYVRSEHPTWDTVGKRVYKVIENGL